MKKYRFSKSNKFLYRKTFKKFSKNLFINRKTNHKHLDYFLKSNKYCNLAIRKNFINNTKVLINDL